MRIHTFVILLALAFLSSCQKDEIPVPPHTPGELNSDVVEMGNLYADQIWYDIETGTEVSRNSKTAFDLAFECSEDGFHILLNGANRMQVAYTNDSNLLSVQDTSGLDFTWDSHTGNLDSTGIGDWRDKDNIYVLDLGKDEFGKSLGLAKALFDSVSRSAYHFRIADFYGNEWTEFSVAKDTAYTYSYFSIRESKSQVWIAPPKNEWDICFTQYTYIYYDMNPMVAYLVTGVLLNPNNAVSAQVFNVPFEDISYSGLETYQFQSRIDHIGWDWKTYDFDQGYYITDASKSYVLTAKSGRLYKIHFLDWYNTNGEKGSATFEFAEL